MQANHSRRFDITVHDTEIDTLKAILQLAVDRLQSSPVHSLSGSPHKSQAGLKADQLLNAKSMITRLADELGMGEPDLEPSKRNDAADALMYALLATAFINPDLRKATL